MQTVPTNFTTRTSQSVRPLAQSLFMSFLKDYDAAVDFFTIGTSLIGGTSPLKGVGSVIQEWDKYTYTDYSSRLLNIEYSREAEIPTSPVTMATLDIELDNHDDLFTPSNTASPLYGYLLPRRPVRFNLGFGTDLIPIFIGLTDGKPEIDDKTKTAKFHCIDFLSAIMNLPLTQEVIYVNYRTDEVISALLQNVAGLATSQYNLDTGGVILPFAYFEKDSKLGDALHDTAQAELGNLRMDENGIIRFENRNNWSSHTSVWTFDRSNTLERQGSGSDTVINVVEVYSNARSVKAQSKLYESTGTSLFTDGGNWLGPGESKDVWIDFKDDDGGLPVTSAELPQYITGASVQSVYDTNQQADGSGPDLHANVSITADDLFATSYKLTFTNSSGTDGVYVTYLSVYGTPATVENRIYQRLQDDTSVGTFDGYEEHPITIRNNLIQDNTAAISIGKIILADRSQDDNQQTFIVKGVPQLQVGDVVTYNDGHHSDTYFVTRLSGTLSTNGFRQTLLASKRTINSYFRIGISTIGGTDQLGP